MEVYKVRSLDNKIYIAHRTYSKLSHSGEIEVYSVRYLGTKSIICKTFNIIKSIDVIICSYYSTI